jgi:hypothetical protein
MTLKAIYGRWKSDIDKVQPRILTRKYFPTFFTFCHTSSFTRGTWGMVCGERPAAWTCGFQ